MSTPRSFWKGALGGAALAAALAWSQPADAFVNACSGDSGAKGCAYAFYAIITGGGLATAIGSQVTLMRGEPDRNWGYTSLGFAGANAIVSGVLLLIGAFEEDEDDQLAFTIWGGTQMTLAIAGLVSGAHAVANDNEPHPSAEPDAAPAAVGVSLRF